MEGTNTMTLKRCNSCPCIHAQESGQAELVQCTACLKELPNLQEKVGPKKSSLKVATRSATSGKSSGVSFGSVELHEHAIMLGCHPDVRKGAPTTISWCPIHSETTSVDDFEAKQGPRRRPAYRMASTQRQEKLFRAGYSLEDLEEVIAEIAEIQRSRKLSAREASDLKRLIHESRRKKQEQRMKRKGLKRFLSF